VKVRRLFGIWSFSLSMRLQLFIETSATLHGIGVRSDPLVLWSGTQVHTALLPGFPSSGNHHVDCPGLSQHWNQQSRHWYAGRVCWSNVCRGQAASAICCARGRRDIAGRGSETTRRASLPIRAAMSIRPFAPQEDALAPRYDVGKHYGYELPARQQQERCRCGRVADGGPRIPWPYAE